MNNRPGDMSDLYLSPVAIELDQRLEALAGQSPPEELEQYVQLRTDRQPRNAPERAELLLESLTHMLPLHGWDVQWAPRGLRLRHDQHQLVLGVPEAVLGYLAT